MGLPPSFSSLKPERQSQSGALGASALKSISAYPTSPGYWSLCGIFAGAQSREARGCKLKFHKGPGALVDWKSSAPSKPDGYPSAHTGWLICEKGRSIVAGYSEFLRQAKNLH